MGMYPHLLCVFMGVLPKTESITIVTKNLTPDLFKIQKTVYFIQEMSFVFEISRKPQLECAASAQQAHKSANPASSRSPHMKMNRQPSSLLRQRRRCSSCCCWRRLRLRILRLTESAATVAAGRRIGSVFRSWDGGGHGCGFRDGGDECGCCCGRWSLRLTTGGECGHCGGWLSMRLRNSPRGCGGCGRLLLWLMARDGGGRDGDYIDSLSNL